MKADLHIHTRYSFDSIVRPENAILRARKIGMDAIAVTEHNNIDSWKTMQELSKKYDFPVILGEEIKTFIDGQRTGEVTGLFLNAKIKSSDPMDVIDEIRSQGGLVVIPHPFDHARQALQSPEKYVKKIHGIEVLNSRTKKENNEKALAFAEKYGLARIGGSDSHSTREIGRAWTEATATTLEEFRKVIEKGKTKAFGRTSGMWVKTISTVAKTGLIGRV
ncbi:MAG: PHP domain-containing protein [Candidatus Aenigmatarchaeota archaeon]